MHQKSLKIKSRCKLPAVPRNKLAGSNLPSLRNDSPKTVSAKGQGFALPGDKTIKATHFS